MPSVSLTLAPPAKRFQTLRSAAIELTQLAGGTSDELMTASAPTPPMASASAPSSRTLLHEPQRATTTQSIVNSRRCSEESCCPLTLSSRSEIPKRYQWQAHGQFDRGLYDKRALIHWFREYGADKTLSARSFERMDADRELLQRDIEASRNADRTCLLSRIIISALASTPASVCVGYFSLRNRREKARSESAIFKQAFVSLRSSYCAQYASIPISIFPTSSAFAAYDCFNGHEFCFDDDFFPNEYPTPQGSIQDQTSNICIYANPQLLTLNFTEFCLENFPSDGGRQTTEVMSAYYPNYNLSLVSSFCVYPQYIPGYRVPYQQETILDINVTAFQPSLGPPLPHKSSVAAIRFEEVFGALCVFAACFGVIFLATRHIERAFHRPTRDGIF